MNYHISRNGQQLGPLPESEVRSLLQRGEISPTDLCWAEGMPDWKPVGQTLTPLASESVTPPAYNPAVPAPAHNPYAAPRADLGRPLPSDQVPLASLGQRLGASILDVIVAMIGAIPFGIGTGMMEEAQQRGEESSTGLILLGIGGLVLLGLFIYTLVLLSTKGQTIGKKMLGIRIANYADGGNPGFVKAFLLRGVVNGLIGIVPFYSLVDICFIFGQERRCIHDLIAGTKVVQC